MDGTIFKRKEVKFLLSAYQRRQLEEAMAERMRPDEFGESTICNIYYDTPDFRLIRRSIDKPAYKEKLRLRSYGICQPDGRVYLELKKKYKGIVYKRRVPMTDREAELYMEGAIAMPSDTQIGREIDYTKHYYTGICPAVYLCYDRNAYFDKDDHDFRMTFDKNIRWRDDDLHLTSRPSGEQILLPGQSLLEVKVAESVPLWLVNVMSELEIRQASFSKYGQAYNSILRNAVHENKGGFYCA